MSSPVSRRPHGLNRRQLLKAAAGAGAAAVLPGCSSVLVSDRGLTASAAILRAQYDNSLVDVIESGFELVPPPDVNGKRVLLKPNFVDLPRQDKPIVTNPAVILAAAEAFKRRGAAEVMVGDGPALQRDAWQIVDAIGLTALLRQDGVKFVDLSTDDVVAVANRGDRLGIGTLYYGRTVVEADVMVSMPKMKTHHWAGASLSMKNLFGTLPGVVYGWPRNHFHLRDLHAAVMDFNRTQPAQYAIIDGVVGLEGDGPVRGTPIDVGVLVMGDNPTAVDATAARIMGLTPTAVTYLRLAAGELGPVSVENIAQRGETIASVRKPFQILDHQNSLTV